MNARAYFKSHFKQNLRPFIIILSVCLILCLVLGLSIVTPGFTYFHYTNDPPAHSGGCIHEEPARPVIPHLNIPVAILCVLCFVAPILEFSTFKQRRNLDCWYSLPISKRALGAVHLLTGYLIVLIPFTVCYIEHLILLLSKGVPFSNVLVALPHYFICVSAGFCIYSIYVFVFNKANSFADGIITMVLGTFAFFVIIVGIASVCNYFGIGGVNLDILINSLVFMPLTELTCLFDYALQNESLTSYLVRYSSDAANIIWIAFWTLFGIASVIFNIRCFGSQRAEKTQECSTSLFCYSTLIPIYAISGILIFQSIIMAAVMLTFAFVGYIIYRRGFHLKRADIISLAALLAVTVLIFSTVFPPA